MSSATFIQLCAGAVLIYIAFSDMSSFRINNRSVIILLMLYLINITISTHPWHTTGYIVFCVVSLVVIIIIYAIGVIGGGDAKLIWVVLLWTGPDTISIFLSILGFASLIYYILHRFIGILPARPGPRGKTFIPFGPCIAAAWIGTMLFQSAA
jgi:prepilin peptidase CpaA